MKSKLILSALLLSGTIVFGQSTEEKPLSKKMPPLSMLKGKPGDVKHIWELPSPMEYKIYNQKGALVEEGNAEFIDLTNYKPGNYFIVYADKKELIQIKKQP